MPHPHLTSPYSLHFPGFTPTLMPQIHMILFIYIKPRSHKFWKIILSFWDWLNSQNNLQFHPFFYKWHNFVLLYDWTKFYCVYIPFFPQSSSFWGISKQELLTFPSEICHLKQFSIPKFSSRLHAMPERSRILDREERRKCSLPWSWIIRKMTSLKLIVNVFSKISSLFKCSEIK